MSDAGPQLVQENARPERHLKAATRFPATVGRFDDPAARGLMDGLAKWVEDRYRDDLKKRPSKHVYVRTLPAPVVEQVDSLRDSAVIRDAMLQHFGPDCVITPMKHTDELYLSHYNKDRGGDQGLYSKHYDGNLRFLPLGSVVRALIYLQSAATYTVVFAASGFEKAFGTHEFGLIDFHRELHWVKGEYEPGDRHRILLKCNYLIVPLQAGFLTRPLLVANTSVFYTVKAAMEYSKSPSSPPQVVVGLLCNLFRVLNNFHPLVPLAFILLAIGALGWGLRLLVT